MLYLALRFKWFRSLSLQSLEVFQRLVDTYGLLACVAAAEKQYSFPANHRVVDYLAWSLIDP